MTDNIKESSYDSRLNERRSNKAIIGGDSQLPFGYCALSLKPSVEPVITPSGNVYSREVMIEYLLNKTKEIKYLQQQYQIQQQAINSNNNIAQEKERTKQMSQFKDNIDGVSSISKRKMNDIEQSCSYLESRKKVIHDSDNQQQLVSLKHSSPWLPSFTPTADQSMLQEPSKRPSSPMSGMPLRSKDLIPINLEMESTTPCINGSNNQETTRYICPVSRKTITNQKVVLIKTTSTVMLESVYKELALPKMTCPITNKKFKVDDVIELKSAASSFASSGNTVVTKYNVLATLPRNVDRFTVGY